MNSLTRELLHFSEGMIAGIGVAVLLFKAFG